MKVSVKPPQFSDGLLQVCFDNSLKISQTWKLKAGEKQSRSIVTIHLQIQIFFQIVDAKEKNPSNQNTGCFS